VRGLAQERLARFCRGVMAYGRLSLRRAPTALRPVRSDDMIVTVPGDLFAKLEAPGLCVACLF